MPLLTIVIPTRNRELELDRCLSALTVAITAAGAENDVAVVVADNFSVDQTPEVVDRHAVRNSWIHYFRHHQPRRTAEESLFHALAFAKTDYVWALGDDDVVTDNSLRLLLPVLREGRVGLVLLNLISKTPDAEHSYYRFPYPSIFYQRGLDLFRDFGVISATMTISCLCFRKSGIEQVDWQRLQDLSPIYSHSCALLIAFRDVPALALGEPTVIYTQNLLAVEHERLSQVAVERQHPTYHAFTIGLIQLLHEVARKIGLPLAQLLKLEEPELSKSDWTVKQSLTGHFVAHHLISQLSLGLGSTSTHERFSDNDICTIREFFKEGGDAELQEVVEQALDSLGSDSAVQCQELGKRLASTQKELIEQEERYFAQSIDVRPDWSGAIILFDDQVPFKWSRGRPANAIGAILPSRESSIRLTILIPTFNRARSLARQLRTLSRLPASRRPDVEILVAENACTDRSVRVLNAGQQIIPSLRTAHFDDHVGSAEENIDRAVPLARGEYVWLLGDDDEPIAPTVELLLHLLDYTQPDFLVFNSSVHNEKIEVNSDIGRKGLCTPRSVLPPGIMSLGAALSERSYVGTLQEFGITTSMAFISRYVFRRAHYVSFGDFIRVSRIYSHVFGMARMCHGREILAVNYSLVARRDSPVFERFKSIASKTGIWFEFPWTVGLVRLSKKAEIGGWMPCGSLQSVREVSTGGRRFQLVDDMFGHMTQQLQLSLETRCREQLPTRGEMGEFAGYFADLPKWLAGARDGLLDVHAKIDKMISKEYARKAGYWRWMEVFGQRRRANRRLQKELAHILLRIHMRGTDPESISTLRRIYIRVGTWVKLNTVIGPMAYALYNNRWLGIRTMLQKTGVASSGASKNL